MELQERKEILARWGEAIKGLDDTQRDEISWRAAGQNAWFTPQSIQKALEGVVHYLEAEQLDQWLAAYKFPNPQPKKIGLVLAGNIPMVGFHDLLCVLVSGHTALVKLSTQDKVLLPYLVNELLRPISENMADQVVFAERLEGMDAVIATGSDNSSRYFDYYFGKYPHIIRRNRSSVAVIDGKESEEDFTHLGRDIFDYFGLGCRNISKLMVPEGYEFQFMLDTLLRYEGVIHHHKYSNNYDYHKSIYLVNKEPHLDTGFLLLRESKDFISPISVLFYEQYSDEQRLKETIDNHKEKIQVITSREAWFAGSLPFGESQQPHVWDYADGVDTLAFLIEQHKA